MIEPEIRADGEVFGELALELVVDQVLRGLERELLIIADPCSIRMPAPVGLTWHRLHFAPSMTAK
jgi:hypothetical protein